MRSVPNRFLDRIERTAISEFVGDLKWEPIINGSSSVKKLYHGTGGRGQNQLLLQPDVWGAKALGTSVALRVAFLKIRARIPKKFVKLRPKLPAAIWFCALSFDK